MMAFSLDWAQTAVISIVKMRKKFMLLYMSRLVRGRVSSRLKKTWCVTTATAAADVCLIRNGGGGDDATQWAMPPNYSLTLISIQGHRHAKKACQLFVDKKN